LDQWLMKLDKVIKDRILISSVYIGVREFHKSKFKNDAIVV